MKKNIAISTYPSLELKDGKIKLITSLYLDDGKTGNLDNEPLEMEDDFQKILDEMLESDIIFPYGERKKTQISTDGKQFHLSVLKALEVTVQKQIKKIEKYEVKR